MWSFGHLAGDVKLQLVIYECLPPGIHLAHCLLTVIVYYQLLALVCKLTSLGLSLFVHCSLLNSQKNAQ
jgi:hypothetical protein